MRFYICKGKILSISEKYILGKFSSSSHLSMIPQCMFFVHCMEMTFFMLNLFTLHKRNDTEKKQTSHNINTFPRRSCVIYANIKQFNRCTLPSFNVCRYIFQRYTSRSMFAVNCFSNYLLHSPIKIYFTLS